MIMKEVQHSEAPDCVMLDHKCQHFIDSKQRNSAVEIVTACGRNNQSTQDFCSLNGSYHNSELIYKYCQ